MPEGKGQSNEAGGVVNLGTNKEDEADEIGEEQAAAVAAQDEGGRRRQRGELLVRAEDEGEAGEAGDDVVEEEGKFGERDHGVVCWQSFIAGDLSSGDGKVWCVGVVKVSPNPSVRLVSFSIFKPGWLDKLEQDTTAVRCPVYSEISMYEPTNKNLSHLEGRLVAQVRYTTVTN